MTVNEATFFNDISKRLGRTSVPDKPPVRDVVGAPGFWSDYDLAPADRVTKFVCEFAKLGGVARVCATQQALEQELSATLEQLQPKYLGVWGGNFVASFGIHDVVQAYDVVAFGNDNGDTVVDDFAKVDVGITGCTYGVADTGSVVLLSGETTGRIVSLLPTVHIVLVRASQMVTRMGEVWQALMDKRLEWGNRPSCVNFVTGPSRSSDIENDLSIGVHGPAAVYAFILLDDV